MKLPYLYIIFRQPSAFTCNRSISLLSHNTTLFLEKSILVFIHESRDFMLKSRDKQQIYHYFHSASSCKHARSSK